MKRHEENFWEDGTVLYLNWDVHASPHPHLSSKKVQGEK